MQAVQEKRIQKGIENMDDKVLEFEHDILIRESETHGELMFYLTSNQTASAEYFVSLRGGGIVD